MRTKHWGSVYSGMPSSSPGCELCREQPPFSFCSPALAGADWSPALRSSCALSTSSPPSSLLHRQHKNESTAKRSSPIRGNQNICQPTQSSKFKTLYIIKSKPKHRDSCPLLFIEVSHQLLSSVAGKGAGRLFKPPDPIGVSSTRKSSRRTPIMMPLC